MAIIKKNIKIKFRTEAEYLFVRQLLMKYKTNLQDFSVKAISEAFQQLVEKYEADRAEREAAKAKEKEQSDARSPSILSEPVISEAQSGGDIAGAVLADQADVSAESSPGP